MPPLKTLLLAALVLGGCPGSDTAADDTDAPVSTDPPSETDATDDTDLPPEEAYCGCVFVVCHEHYHDRWGEDEILSAAACREQAQGWLAEAGGQAELECRLAVCEAATPEDEVDCPLALGEGTCPP